MAMRSYSSGHVASDNGPGYGWKVAGNAHLTVDPGTGNVNVSQENGSKVNSSIPGNLRASATRFIGPLAY